MRSAAWGSSVSTEANDPPPWWTSPLTMEERDLLDIAIDWLATGEARHECVLSAAATRLEIPPRVAVALSDREAAIATAHGQKILMLEKDPDLRLMSLRRMRGDIFN